MLISNVTCVCTVLTKNLLGCSKHTERFKRNISVFLLLLKERTPPLAKITQASILQKSGASPTRSSRSGDDTRADNVSLAAIKRSSRPRLEEGRVWRANVTQHSAGCHFCPTQGVVGNKEAMFQGICLQRHLSLNCTQP